MVYTKNTTLNPEVVRDVIPALFELLRSEGCRSSGCSGALHLCLYSPLYGW